MTYLREYVIWVWNWIWSRTEVGEGQARALPPTSPKESQGPSRRGHTHNPSFRTPELHAAKLSREQSRGSPRLQAPWPELSSPQNVAKGQVRPKGQNASQV